MTSQRRAFPNAYIEVDEPPNRVPRLKLLSLVAIVGVAWFGLTILLLSFIDAEFSPISQAASDYGVGHFALEMNLGFLVGGVGLLAYSLATSMQESGRRSRAASALFFVAGLILIMDSYFTTNVEGNQVTLHGTIHGFGGLIFFIAGPVGTILMARRFGRRWLLTTLMGFAAGFGLLAVNAGLSGLAERIILLVIFLSVILMAKSIWDVRAT